MASSSREATSAASAASFTAATPTPPAPVPAHSHSHSHSHSPAAPISISRELAHHGLSTLPPLRVLLLDNYDSYTYNLVELIARLVGTQPIVRFNTASLEEIRQVIKEESVDAVVISPGPGHPENDEDFGVCKHVYDDNGELATIPVLGVCLGLQGQWCSRGGRVVKAHEPMHGRLSPLIHDGEGLFQGVPQGVKVVRYNSLVADPTPPARDLQVSAWAECEGAQGVREIMAVRDVSQGAAPMPGSPSLPPLRESIQFHPESICTHYGWRMAYNFFHMVAERKRLIAESMGQSVQWCEKNVQPIEELTLEHDPVQPTTNGASQPSESSDTSDSPYVLLCHKLPFYVDSESTFMELHGASCIASSTVSPSSGPSSSTLPSSFWLDSSKVETGRSRSSFMGDSSGPLSYSLWYDACDPLNLHIQRCSESALQPDEIIKLQRGEQVWQEMQRLIQERSCPGRMVHDLNEPLSSIPSSSTASTQLPFAFESGLVGYIGYAMRQMCAPDSLPPIHINWEEGAASHDSLPPNTVNMNGSSKQHGTHNSAQPAPSASGTSSASTSSSSSASTFRPPDLAFLFADRLLVFDHEDRECYLLCLCRSDGTIPSASITAGRDWMHKTTRQLAELNSRTTQPHTAAPPSSIPSFPSDYPVSVSTHHRWFHSQPQYLRAINNALRVIREGHSYEICLTNELNVTVEASTPQSDGQTIQAAVRPIDYYRVLRSMNPAPYAAFFSMQYRHFSSVASPPSSPFAPSSTSPATSSSSSWSICCSSPERFLRVARGGIVESKPIKGTLPRGSTPEEDERLRIQLAQSNKDFAENLMIVDLLRNDLSHVCRTGSVCVPKLMEVESYATVHQLVSTVRGRLRQGVHTPDVIRAAFPPGSMTGAPKLRSCQILAQLEEEPAYRPSTSSGIHPPTQASSAVPSSTPVGCGRERGIYSGCIGWIGINGGVTDLNVVIRTAIIHQTSQVDMRPMPHQTVDADGHERGEAIQSGGAPPSLIPHVVHHTHFRIGAGGAIVYLSDPQGEYDEMLLKTKALLQAIDKSASDITCHSANETKERHQT